MKSQVLHEEKRKARYKELVEKGLLEKYFGGKTLEERTMINYSPLEDICLGELSTPIHSNHYCRISFYGKKPLCKYAGGTDQNNFTLCAYLDEFIIAKKNKLTYVDSSQLYH